MSETNNSQLNERTPERLLKDGFFPLVALASKYGYAKDHIGRLARTGRVQATRCGNKGEWFVNEASLEKYHREVTKDRFAPAVTLDANPNDSPVLAQIEDAPQSAAVLSNDEGSLNAEPTDSIPTGMLSRGTYAILTLAIVLGGVFVSMNFDLVTVRTRMPTVAQGANVLEVLGRPFSILFDLLFRDIPEPKNYLVDRSLKAPPADEPIALTSSSPTPSPSANASPAPTPQAAPSNGTGIERIVIAQTLNSNDLEAIRVQLAESQLRLDGFQNVIDSLNQDVSALQRIRPAAVLPMEYFGTNPQTTIGANTLTSEKLTVSGQATLESLSVSGNLSLGSSAFFVDGAAGRVGIGTNTLETAFELVGTASISENLIVGGNVTINGQSITGPELSVTGSGSFTGRLTLNNSPTVAHTGTWPNFTGLTNSTLFLNPTSPVADGNIIAYANGNDAKFVVDAEGDVFANNLVLTGSTTQGTTTIAGDLNVEGNVRLGDASTDRIRIVGTILPNTLTSNIFTIQASPSWSGGHYLRVLNSVSTPIFTVASTSNAALAGNLTVSGTASSSFAGSVDVTKGLRAAQITGTGLTINGNANVSGALTALTYSGLTITSSTGTLTIANGKTLTASNTLTFAGTDGQTFTFPNGSDTVVTLTATQVLTNKTLMSPVITGGTINNAVIGGSTPAAGTFTTLAATTLSITTASASTNFEVGGYASIGGNVLTRGNLSASGTGSSSFAGSVDVAKGLRAAHFTQVGSADSYFSGNVGIGSTAATAPLDISKNLGVTSGERELMRAFNGTSAGIGFGYRADGASAIGGYIRSTAGLPLFIETNGTPQAITLLNNGNVGIGTTSPISRFNIAETSTSYPRGPVFGQHADSAASSIVGLRRSRGTAAAPTSVSNGDFIGLISGDVYDGTSYLLTGHIGFKVNGTVSAGAVPTDIIFSAGSTNDAAVANERMRITSSGNVGIGTTVPGERLDVVGGSIKSANSFITSGGGLRFDGTTSPGANPFIYSPAANVIAMATGGIERFRVGNSGASLSIPFEVISTASIGNSLCVQNNGNVGIGTTNPSITLDVVGGISIQSNNNLTWGGAFGAGVPTISGVTGSGLYLYPTGSTSGATMRIDGSGNVGIGTTVPMSTLEVVGRVTSSQIGGLNAGTQGVVQLIGNGSVSPVSGRLTYGTDGTGWQFRIAKNQLGTTTDQLTIVDSGNVGIGTTGPGSKLDLAGASPRVHINPDSGGAQLWLDNTVQTWGIEVAASGTDSNLTIWDRDGGNPRLTIKPDGNVGIGTADPSYKLHVRSDGLAIRSETTGASAIAGNFHALNTSFAESVIYSQSETAPGTGWSLFRGYSKPSGYDLEFNLRGDGNAFADGSWSGGGADVAEWMPTTDIGLQSGDVLAVDGSGADRLVRKSLTVGDTAIGIVSTNPGLITGGGSAEDMHEHDALVALAGRVPTKVSLENGPVSAGDRLTLSSTPGVAMKMTEAGQSVGIALEPLNTIASGSYAKILTFVNVGYWAPSTRQAVMTSGGGNILAGIGATPEGLLAEMAGTLLQWLKDALASGSIQLVKAVEGVFTSVKTDRLEVEQGVTLIDRTTGQPYCFYVDNGVTTSTPGACGGTNEPAISNSQESSDGGLDNSENDGVVSSATPSSEPDVTLTSSGDLTATASSSSSPTPSPSPTPETSATPEPSPSPSPTPEVSPSPSPSPSPALDSTPAPSPEATPASAPAASPTPSPTPESTPEATPTATPEPSQ